MVVEGNLLKRIKQTAYINISKPIIHIMKDSFSSTKLGYRNQCGQVRLRLKKPHPHYYPILRKLSVDSFPTFGQSLHTKTSDKMPRNKKKQIEAPHQTLNTHKSIVRS
jgi:hypothetical protein